MSVNLPLSVKDIVTPSARDVSQDCTSMIMPSGVSSFLLDCMDSDLEAGEPLPSIETLCKADTYDEGTGLISEDEMLHCYIKNSTLLSFSDAVNIGMQHPPNLSSILELSPVIDGKIAKESFSLPPSQPVSPLGSVFQEELVDLSNVPKEYMDLKGVFSKSRAASLPPHRPYDCAIDLLSGAGFFFVGKKDGSLQPCIDYQGLNSITLLTFGWAM
ncbi:uncharacterized protein LOC113535751 isoform X3 [Pangasianodon hypophthalmus]|uniref:uncharacterized protein LOC113535751 isoform X3 n=1 Tax=Pangasianodon hypophthalmus TaxID=310915 RepID=UPI00147ED3DB|nr:uncharacterized protein LOC113535751 isoform X3 [Pangasianodon hypophthalmus]